MDKKIISIVIAVIVVIAVGAGAFFGGMKYQQAHAAAGRSIQFAAGRFGGRMGEKVDANTAIFGQITSNDTNSITVKLNNGSSKIINLANSTKITKTDTAKVSDLTTNSQVAVFGIPNTDGSITALTIQLNPVMRAGQMLPRPSATQ